MQRVCLVQGVSNSKPAGRIRPAGCLNLACGNSGSQNGAWGTMHNSRTAHFCPGRSPAALSHPKPATQGLRVVPALPILSSRMLHPSRLKVDCVGTRMPPPILAARGTAKEKGGDGVNSWLYLWCYFYQLWLEYCCLLDCLLGGILCLP